MFQIPGNGESIGEVDTNKELIQGESTGLSD